MPKKIRVLTWGGLGDILLSTPAIAALKKKHPDRKIVVLYQWEVQKEIFKDNPHVDELRYISFLKIAPLLLFRWLGLMKVYTANYGLQLPGLFYKKNAIEINADLLDVKLDNKQIQVYVTKEEDRKAKEFLSAYVNPVIIHITSLTSKNQEWPIEYWNKLVRSMPGYTFLQLGFPGEEQVEGAIDLRGKTTFREALALIKHSLSFVGVNSSFSHATNAFNVPGVVLFGPSNPEVWGHDLNINIYNKLRCSPCIDLIYGSPCPYNRACMRGIAVQEVKNALLQLLNKRGIPVTSNKSYHENSHTDRQQQGWKAVS